VNSRVASRVLSIDGSPHLAVSDGALLHYSFFFSSTFAQPSHTVAAAA
jgi:hypothetical protein